MLGSMTTHNIAAVILAAGRGTRMRSDTPKVLHQMAGRPLIGHALDLISGLIPERTVVVVGPGMDAIGPVVAPHPTVIQENPRGTADAVKAARDALATFGDGSVLIIFGDTPLVQAETLRHMIEARQSGAAIVILGFSPDDPTGYGRLIQDADGSLAAIVEDVDLEEAQREIALCNSGVMAVNAAHLMTLVDATSDDNAKGEFYLTDIVGIARGQGLACAVVEAPAAELVGVDSRADLAVVEAYWQQLRRARAMGEGATLVAPETVWFSYDTELGRDVVIGPNVQFGPGVTLGDGVEVRAFCHLEGAAIEDDAVIGPFARLRAGAKIGAGSRIGNFVEVKNAVLGEGVRAGHLAYLGDAQIGAGVNIGAGTITCNYDGVDKHRTVIGAGAFIGTNSSLVAPVTIGNGAFVAAGSVITDDVSDDALAIARGRQAEMPGRAARMRDERGTVESATASQESEPKPTKTADVNAPRPKRRKTG
jgi:bifunctional UDP-N-acetylglucosamine pyrophosphorylase/glucosamine-1-phosphate N-acetyltransferase